MSKSKSRKRTERRAQETVKYDDRHWISGQTEDVLNEHIKPMTGRRISDHVRAAQRIPAGTLPPDEEREAAAMDPSRGAGHGDPSNPV